MRAWHVATIDGIIDTVFYSPEFDEQAVLADLIDQQDYPRNILVALVPRSERSPVGAGDGSGEPELNQQSAIGAQKGASNE